MSENPKSIAAPFSLRLSWEERERLEQDAAGLPRGEYIRQKLFGESVPKRHTRNKHPVKDYHALGQVLGKVGQARLASNLNQLAKAANCGNLVLSPEIQLALLEACADIRAIRQMLLKALGVEQD